MKRNLSSQAIRAMAIGMAVTLGSATAISGVVTGSVVNVYAAAANLTTKTIGIDGSDILITLTDANDIDKNSQNGTEGFTITAGEKTFTGDVSKGSVEAGDSNKSIKVKVPISELETAGFLLDGTETFSLAYSGNGLQTSSSAYTLSKTELDGKVDKVAPTLKSVAYDKNKNTVTIKASENLSAISKETQSGNFSFKIEKDGSPIEVESIEAQDNSKDIVITLKEKNTKLTDGEYTITYLNKDTVKDKATTPNKLANDSNVTLTLDTTAPTLESASYSKDNNTITIKASEDLSAISKETQSGNFSFKIEKDGSPIEVESIEAQDNSKDIVITLKEKNTKLTDGEYIITYLNKDTVKDKADPANKLVNDSTVKLIVGDQAENKPSIENTAVYDKGTNTVTLISDKELNVLQSTDNGHGFTIKGATNKNVEIENVQIKADYPKNIIIKVKGEALKDDTYTIGYTQSTANISTKDGSVKLDSNPKLATFEVKADTVQGDLTATTSAGTYTFKNLGVDKVALVRFATLQTRAAQTNTFENGVLTADGKTYTLTQIGDGTKVDGLTTKALEGHTSNVTTIKENAFNGNTNVTTLTFPNVTKVEANAFSGATSLTSIDLGSASKNLELADNAFTGAASLKNIATSKENKNKVDAVIKSSNIQATVITDENSNATDATIEAGKFYQTKEGLIFKGIDSTKLSFEGKEKYTAPTKPNGLDGKTQETAYLVTYANGIVTLKAGETTPQPPATENFEVNNVNGKKLTFTTLSGKKEVALTGVGDATRGLESNILRDGVLTVNGNAYDFTQIGDGITSLGVDFKANEVLEGNLDKVTTVAKNAFKDNTALKQISLPNVTSVESGSFSGTNKLESVFLGNGVVTVGEGAFTGTKHDIKVSSNNKTTIDNLKNNNTGLIQSQIENAAPFVISSVINDNEPNKVVVTFSEKVYAPINITPGDFTLEGEGKKLNATNVDGLKNSVDQATSTVTLTLDGNVKGGENRTLKFNKTGEGIKDVEDKELENISGVEVTNNVIKVEAVEVTVTGATTNDNGKQLTINVEKDLADNQNLDKAGFVVSKESGNSDINVKSASVNGKVITLTLEDANPVKADHTGLKVEYNGSDLLQKDTNKPIKEFTTPFVVNKLDVTNPTLKDNEKTASTTETEKKYIITLPASEPIKLNGTNDEVKGAFTVTVVDGSKKVNSTSVAVGDDGKSLVLTVTTDKVLTPTTDKFKVVYNQDNERVKDLKDNKLATVTINDIVLKQAVGSSVFFSNSDSDIDLVATSLLKSAEVEVANGKVTVVNKFKGADQSVIQSMLTSDLTKIAGGAFNGISDMTLDFSKISNVDSVIDSKAFDGASKLKIEYKGNSEEAYKLAKKLENVSDVTVNDKKPNDVIRDYENNNNNNGGSGGGSSSGGSGGGSGANIGTITNKEPNTEETTSQGNNNNETVIENKQLSFDVIKLPSVEGEAKVFGDVSANHWAKSYIDKLSTAGIINGSNGMFNPNGQTKRADVTVMLVNLLGLTPEANNKFADVNASAYYAPYVGTASTYGIVNGSNGMFNPQGVISRQDTMVMIAQILKGLNLNVNADATALSQFGDASKVSAYANESVAILVNSGIISGNNGKLNPTAPVTRAEMATIMSKLYDVLASANK